MSIKAEFEAEQRISHSILAFSHNAIIAYRFFTKEDFLHMMSDMSPEDIVKDLERFKKLEEYKICQKIQFVLEQKIASEKMILQPVLD